MIFIIRFLGHISLTCSFVDSFATTNRFNMTIDGNYEIQSITSECHKDFFIGERYTYIYIMAFIMDHLLGKRECIAMSVKEFNKEELEKMSMVDVAETILVEEKQPLSFVDTFNKVATLKEWDDVLKKSKIAQFYTDLNMDGRFITNGSNTWGLKRWYTLDSISAELTNPDMEVVEDDGEIGEEESIVSEEDFENDYPEEEEDFDESFDDEEEED